MQKSNWKYRLWVCLTYEEHKAKAKLTLVRDRYGRHTAETIGFDGDLEKFMRRLKRETKAHWSVVAGFAAVAKGEFNPHIHLALASPDCSFDRYLKAFSFCKDSKHWSFGRVKHVRKWDESKATRGHDYVRKHDYTPWLERHVYCPMQSNSCRKGRCKHNMVL